MLQSCSDSRTVSWLWTPLLPALSVRTAHQNKMVQCSKLICVVTSLLFPSDEATADGSDLLWVVPYSPLPLVDGQLKDRGMRVGVDGEAVSEADIKERGYRLEQLEGQVEVRIPAGAPGGHITVCS